MAKDDPFWAVSTAPQYQGGKWDPAEFFATGQSQVIAILDYAEKGGLPVSRGKALDFGSGLGRLTQALADQFEQVLGVDIAPAMVAQAAALNRHGESVEYLLNEVDDLATLASQTFDFVLSEITLMHMRPDYSKRYIGEFVRLLRPGGVAVFQLPDPTAKQRIKEAIPHFILDPALRLRAKHAPRMEIYGIIRAEVERATIAAGATIALVEEIHEGQEGNRRYYVVA
jgi:SAM-dependent methyltransferase